MMKKSLDERLDILSGVAKHDASRASVGTTIQLRPIHQRPQQAASKLADAPSAPAGTLEEMRERARACTRCDLYYHATQTVFGEGPADAKIMFVGEQPGDQEDLAGRPFVGPAGKVLDQVIGEVGIDRSSLYVTNAVKHFKFEPRGKRRIHQKPNMGEVRQCRWWLDLELALIKPRLVVAMGATALFAMTDKNQRLEDVRGKPIALSEDRRLFVTVHPSYLLRIPDEKRKREEWTRFSKDMAAVRRLAG